MTIDINKPPLLIAYSNPKTGIKPVIDGSKNSKSGSFKFVAQAPKHEKK